MKVTVSLPGVGLSGAGLERHSKAQAGPGRG